MLSRISAWDGLGDGEFVVDGEDFVGAEDCHGVFLPLEVGKFDEVAVFGGVDFDDGADLSDGEGGEGLVFGFD
jgi:hypothetical protein